jgi:hypothetical protein
MKQVISFITQRILQEKHDPHSGFPSNGNQQLAYLNFTSFSGLQSTPSNRMRMCACSMSC